MVQGSIEDALNDEPCDSIDRFNLSDIFEYMSEENTAALLTRCIDHGRPGGRLVYWNMLVPRSCPGPPHPLAERLRPLDDLAYRLHQRDRAFFYNRLVIEELR